MISWRGLAAALWLTLWSGSLPSELSSDDVAAPLAHDPDKRRGWQSGGFLHPQQPVPPRACACWTGGQGTLP